MVAKKAKSTKTALTTSLSPDGSLSRYLQEIRKFPMLEAKQEYKLAKKYADDQDTASAHMLVTSHLRLVAKIATGYRGYGLPLGEVIQEGNIGLMQAVKKFDPERGFRLATYAMWWIRASIQEYILRSWSLVKIGTTAAQKKLFFNLRRLKSEIAEVDSGYLKPEQVKQIADTLKVNETDVRLMEGRMAGGDSSLNTPMRDSSGEDGSEWQDWISDERESHELVLAEKSDYEARKRVMLEAMAVLNERETAILTARRLQDPPITLEELSHTHKVSRERIRQIESRAFDKLRTAMTDQASAQGIIEVETASQKN